MVRFINQEGQVIAQQITDKKGRVWARLPKGEYTTTVNFRSWHFLTRGELREKDSQDKKFLTVEQKLIIKHTKSLNFYLPISAQ
jgi:hypothetical protein